MNERTASRLALVLLWMTIGLAGFTVVALAIGTAVTYGSGNREDNPALAFLFVGGILGTSLLGTLIVRRSGNVIGLAFQAMALAASIAFATDVYIQFALGGEVPRQLPGLPIAGWANNLATLWIALPIPAIFLLFPTGIPVSPRWRWTVRLWAAATAANVLWAAFRPGDVYGQPDGPDITNPLGVQGIDPVFEILVFIGGFGALAAAVLGVVALGVRFRRSRGEERAQMKWLALVAVTAAVTVAFSAISTAVLGENTRAGSLLGSLGWGVLAITLLVGVPVSVAIAVLKYRLYDIDVVINKAVVYGALAAFITLVYTGIVIGVGALVGDRGVVVSIAATTVVAIAFQPVRERVQRVANRLVYGERATPYEVLAQFSERVAGTYATEDVLPRTARVIAEGTGAERAEVWVRVGEELRATAAWPEADIEAAALPLEGEALPAFQGADRAVPVRRGEELLGAITITKRKGERVTLAEENLLRDLAQQAGVVLSNARLTAELEASLARISAQAAELRASRQRIVSAQDEERRRLERNIHDGAQQHLVALAVKVRLAKGLITKDPVKAGALLEELREEASEAIDTLNALSLGIYPPLLEEQGIATALAAQYLRSGLPVQMETDGTTRYAIETEAAVYFCVLEALQNAAKYARATSIRIRLAEWARKLTFEVEDDGTGFDPASAGTGTGLQGMIDRLAVLGGTVEVLSAPGRGTLVRGRVPILQLAGAR